MSDTKTVFNQLCVWQGITLSEDQYEDFVEFFANELDTRIKLAEVVLTNPDLDEGEPVPETGGRSDILFYVHDEDVTGFALKRLQLDGGVRWWEDVVSYNDNSHLYDQEVLDRYAVKW
tara:strand:+ start:350 stop:703 length:354 start_codon:yes stop_codon:yes gene_type:complete